MYSLYLVDYGIKRSGHELVHRGRLVAFDEIRFVAIADEEARQLVMRDAREHGRAGYLVAVEVEYRQNRPVVDGVEELVGVPARGERPGLGLAVADDAGREKAGIVVDRPVRVREGVAELAALVDGAGSLRRDVAGYAAGKRELPEKILDALFVTRDARIDLGVGAFEVDVCHDAGAAVPGAGDVDDVEVALLDDAVEVDVDEVQARGRAPVAEEAGLDVPAVERLLEERIVVEIDLADGEVVGGPPIGVHPAEHVLRQRLVHQRVPPSKASSVRPLRPA